MSFSDYRLNPVLRKACKADIPKFCQSVLNTVKDGKELEGQVVSCLKMKYADQVLKGQVGHRKDSSAELHFAYFSFSFLPLSHPDPHCCIPR